MSTYHKPARVAWIGARMDYDEHVVKRQACESSIATAQKILADLEVGIGAPKDVPSWLALKTDLGRRIEEEIATLLDLRQQEDDLDTKRRELMRACQLAVLQDMHSEVGPRVLKVRAALAAIRADLSDLFAVGLLLQSDGDFEAQRLAAQLLSVRDASVIVDNCWPSDTDVEAAKQKWRARAAAIASEPITEDTVQQAAE